MAKQTYRIISVVGILVAVGAILFGIWSVARQGSAMFGIGSSDQNLSSDTREVSLAKNLDIEGMWDVTISQGKPALKFKASADQLKNIEFTQNGDRISLSQNSHGFKFGGPVRMELSMPELSDIKFAGAGSMSIQDLKAKDLNLTVQGGLSVTMQNSVVESLHLSSEGACNVDLGASTITNADVNLQGASNVTINMAGGTLGGQIEGVGHLGYTGTVSSETVRTDGLAKVEKK